MIINLKYFCMQPHSQHFSLESPNFPTMQSIEAQSEYSIDLKPTEHESMMIQLLLFSIQLDRKDMLIDQLRNNVVPSDQLKKSQIQHTDLKGRYEKMQMQNRELIEKNAVLRNKLQKATTDTQLYKNHARFNQELEEKVRSIENQLHKTKQANISLQQNLKTLKTQISMQEYEKITKASEKNRIKELQHEISALKAKLDKNQLTITEQKHLVERYSHEIHSLKQQQIIRNRAFEQKIQLIRVNEDLKKSQCFAASDQKIMLLTQQLNRLKQQAQSANAQLSACRAQTEEKNQQIRKLNQDIVCYEQQLQRFQQYHNSYQNIDQQLQQQTQKNASLSEIIKELQIKWNKVERQKIQVDNEVKMLHKNLQQKSVHEIQHKKMIQQLQKENGGYEEEIRGLKTEIRKIKRTNQMKQCQICKIKSSSKISVRNSGDPLSLDELIKETQKLKQSNSKIQNLISYHEFTSQNSIDIKTNSRLTIQPSDKY